jgi:hypothetical protein
MAETPGDKQGMWSRELNEKVIVAGRFGLLALAQTVETADNMLRTSKVIDLQVARNLRMLIKVGREGTGTLRALVIQAMADLEKLERDG